MPGAILLAILTPTELRRMVSSDTSSPAARTAANGLKHDSARTARTAAVKNGRSLGRGEVQTQKETHTHTHTPTHARTHTSHAHVTHQSREVVKVSQILLTENIMHECTDMQIRTMSFEPPSTLNTSGSGNEGAAPQREPFPRTTGA